MAYELDQGLNVHICGRQNCPPGHRYGPALRGYHLMHIVASGRGVFDNGVRGYEIRAGQGFMIFPDDVTVYAADEQLPWDYVWIGFVGRDAEALVRSAGFSREHPVFELGRYVRTALDIAYGICEDISLLQQSESAAVGGLLRLMAYIAQSRYDVSPQRTGADCYQRALWALNAHYQRADFLVSDMASFVGLSRSQLYRIFKDRSGSSPQEMLGERRLSHAKRLLSSTDLSLTEVALSSGFSSEARMGEVFRRELQVTPSAYRVAWQRGTPSPEEGGAAPE